MEGHKHEKASQCFLEEMMLKKRRNKLYGSVRDVLGCCRIIQAMMIEQLLCVRLCHSPRGEDTAVNKKNLYFCGIDILVLGLGRGRKINKRDR